MAVFRVTVTKRLDTGHDALASWSNVYHVNRTDMAGAALAAPELVTLEKALYPDNVHIYRYSVSDPLNPQSGFSKGVFEGGNRSVGSVATQLPRWNVVRAKLNVATGRPSQMSLRIIPDESEVDDGGIIATVFNALTDNWATPLVGLGYVSDEDGQIIQSVALNTLLSNRQTGWHRRTRVGFHRGWVAN